MPDRLHAPVAFRSVCLLMILFLIAAAAPHASAAAPGVLPAASAVSSALAFVATADAQAPFAAYDRRATLFFRPSGVTLALPKAGQLQVDFLDTRADVRLSASQRAAGVVNRYVGSDPAGWLVGASTYATLTYRGLYDGIDLRYDGQSGTLKGTYTVARGADPLAIRWRYAGAQQVTLDRESGALHLTLSDGRTVTEDAPVAWQETAGGRVPVAVEYTLEGDEAGFSVGAYDARLPLVIDPSLVSSTYLGGNSTDDIYAVDVDGQGNVIVTGQTYSSAFPGAPGPRKGTTDVFVTKLNAQGNGLVFTTILGGQDDEMGHSVAVDSQGRIWVTGETESDDFPLQSPLYAADFSNGFLETFVSKLDAGGGLLFSTNMGWDVNDIGRAIAVDPQGNAYVAGETQERFGPQAYASKIAADGSSEMYAVVFGAAERGFDMGSVAHAIAVDATGSAYITGRTNSIVFPVHNPFQATCAEDDGWDCTGDDAFLVKLGPAGTDLVFGTYFGGSSGGSDTGSGSDEGRAIALDAQGYIYIAGQTFAPDLPTKNAFQGTRAGPDNFSDAFVAKFTPAGNALVYSTYLGGGAWEEGRGLAVDAAGNAYLAGFTSSDDFPVTLDALQPAIGRGFCQSGSTERYCYDGFVAGFNPTGGRTWGTYLGGNNEDFAYAVAFGQGAIYVAGKTESHDFPTTVGSYQPSKALSDDGFITKFQVGGSEPPPPLGDERVYLPMVRR
jgi:hypothetical protein